jgi:STE24 endopeptidase
MIYFNLFLIIYLGFYVITSLADMVIDKINADYVEKSGDEVPKAFKGIIDEDELKRIRQYTVDKSTFSLIQAGVLKIVFLFIILSGILPWLAVKLTDINYILAGLIFFGIPGLLTAITELPFDYYHSFVIEERYGFNTKTFKIWVSDTAKSFLLIIVLGVILLSSLFLLIRYAGDMWWVYACAFFLGFQLLMTVLYPTVIAPIFNKFTPINDPELIFRIEDLAKREGLEIKGIYQMDATKRSRHTNAYFSGLGKAKRIVLFDSLIQSHDADEIMAVLAHEIGHLKKNHIKKQLALSTVVSVLLFYLASKMITWEPMFEGFGFSIMPAYAGLFLVGIMWEPVSFFLGPAGMALSRRFEREADLYSLRIIRDSGPLVRALKKIAKDNLSNLQPHPLYAWLNYSHSPLLERIRTLESHDPIKA